MRNIVLGLAVATVLLVSPINPAQANCVPLTLDEQAAAASTVATGRVLSLEALAPGTIRVTVQFDWIYKGRSQDLLRFEIDGGADQLPSVDVPLRAGARYLFYMVSEGAQLTTNACAGTREIGADEKPVVPGVKPGYGPGASPGRKVEVPFYITGLGLLVSFALILGAFVLARNIGRRPPITGA